MRREIGLILRMTGPFIEILAVLTYIQYGSRTVPGLGLPVRLVCFGAMGLGLALVVIGLALSFGGRSRRERRDPERRRFDLDLGVGPEVESESER